MCLVKWKKAAAENAILLLGSVDPAWAGGDFGDPLGLIQTRRYSRSFCWAVISFHFIALRCDKNSNLDRPIDRQTDRQTDRPTDGRTDGFVTNIDWKTSSSRRKRRKSLDTSDLGILFMGLYISPSFFVPKKVFFQSRRLDVWTNERTKKSIKRMERESFPIKNYPKERRRTTFLWTFQPPVDFFNSFRRRKVEMKSGRRWSDRKKFLR